MADESQLLKHTWEPTEVLCAVALLLINVTTTCNLLGHNGYIRLRSAFFGLLCAFHAATLYHTAKRRPDHMQPMQGRRTNKRPIGAAC